ncbi:MAG: hypothetical protein KDH09_08410 [Chrysiogenetes bacterium]|nr:hypothetical protein [Chrysiogenetes bacterium]
MTLLRRDILAEDKNAIASRARPELRDRVRHWLEVDEWLIGHELLYGENSAKNFLADEGKLALAVYGGNAGHLGGQWYSGCYYWPDVLNAELLEHGLYAVRSGTLGVPMVDAINGAFCVIWHERADKRLEMCMGQLESDMFNRENQRQNDAVDALRRFENLDPEEQLEADLRSGHIHFLAVTGYSTSWPGTDFIEVGYCFGDAATTHVIDETHDVIESDEHWRLKANAAEFAANYNRKLREHLRKSGLSKCEPGEDWDAAWMEANNRVRGAVGDRAGMAFPWSQDKQVPTFSITIEDLEVVSELQPSVCAVFARHGIHREVHFDLVLLTMYEHEKLRYPLRVTKQAGEFICRPTPQ